MVAARCAFASAPKGKRYTQICYMSISKIKVLKCRKDFRDCETWCPLVLDGGFFFSRTGEKLKVLQMCINKLQKAKSRIFTQKLIMHLDEQPDL